MKNLRGGSWQRDTCVCSSSLLITKYTSMDGLTGLASNTDKEGGIQPLKSITNPTPTKHSRSCWRPKRIKSPAKPDVWISSRKMYSLVGIIDLILNQMDLDSRISEDEFDDKWDYFLDILEEEVIGKG